MENMICVQRYTHEMSTPSIFTRNFKTNTYDSCDTCVYVWRRETDRPLQVLSSKFTVLWAVFMTTPRGCVSKGGTILAGGHQFRQHQALFAQVLGLLRRLRQGFLLDDLWTRRGHPDNSLHSSAAVCKRQISSNVLSYAITSECCFYT